MHRKITSSLLSNEALPLWSLLKKIPIFYQEWWDFCNKLYFYDNESFFWMNEQKKEKKYNCCCVALVALAVGCFKHEIFLWKIGGK